MESGERFRLVVLHRRLQFRDVCVACRGCELFVPLSDSISFCGSKTTDQSSFSPSACVWYSSYHSKIPMHLQGPYFFGSTCESESSCPRSNFHNFGEFHFRWTTLTIADVVQKATLLELGMTPLELGVTSFTVANDCESCECWQHIVSGTVIMAKRSNVSKNLTSFLYVLSESWCYWGWEWSSNT